MPKLPGIEHAITSNEAFHLETLPERMVVVGGGYIAVEFAGIFNGLGAEATVLYRGEQVLRGFDDDVRHFLQDEMGKQGHRRALSHRRRAHRQGGRRACGDARCDGATIEADAVMYATGRRPLTRDLGLEKVGVALDDIGAIKVDG